MSHAQADLDALTREYAANKAEADRLTARNTELADVFVNAAQFKPGSNTGHFQTDGFKVTVTRRFNVRWDAEKLEAARKALADDLFFQVFRWKYEPRSAADLNGFLNISAPEYREPVLAAMETNPGKPGVELKVLQ